MALQFIITNAGRTAVASSISAGTGPVRISTIKLGDASWTPDATATGALQSLKATISAVGGTSVSTDSIHVTGTDATSAAYDVKEIGIYTDAGILFAIYSQATPILTKSAATVAVISVDLVISGVPASSVTVTSANTFYDPPSSSTLAGVIRIATTAEAQTGTLDTAALTPKKLQDVTSTEARNGVLRIATSAESLSGVIDTAIVTPKKLKEVIAAIPTIVASTESVSGIIKLATAAEAQNGTDDTKAITPKKLQDASTSANIASRLVKRDASGNFLAGTITASLNGNAWSSTIAEKASTLSQGGGTGSPMTFNWNGQGGQPTWLWGGNDGTNHYVYNPSNFNVNHANSAGSAGNGAASWVAITGTTTIQGNRGTWSITKSSAGKFTYYNTSITEASTVVAIGGGNTAVMTEEVDKGPGYASLWFRNSNSTFFDPSEVSIVVFN